MHVQRVVAHHLHAGTGHLRRRQNSSDNGRGHHNRGTNRNGGANRVVAVPTASIDINVYIAMIIDVVGAVVNARVIITGCRPDARLGCTSTGRDSGLR